MLTKNLSTKIPSGSPASSIRSASKAKNSRHMKAKPAKLILSLAVLALGIGVAVGASQLSSAGGYARVGPNAAPAVIAGGLILLGAWLAYAALSGGWRNAISDDTRSEERRVGKKGRTPGTKHDASTT